MIEFEVNGVQYRAEKMDALCQFHVARRLASVFRVSGDAIEEIRSADAKMSASRTDAEKKDNASAIIAAINGFVSNLAEQDDATLDYIINACLDTVSRKSGGGWAAVRSNGATMFDLTLFEICYIVYKVVKANIAGFFASLPKGLKEAFQAMTADAAALAAKMQPSGN